MPTKGKRHPEAPLDFNADGWCQRSLFRARPSWFGFAVVERLWQNSEGERQWRKISSPVVIPVQQWEDAA